jgi:hypothetical protein
MTISGLQQATRPRVDSEDGDGHAGLVGDVAKWCEGLDEFGTLVWMAVLLD